MMTRLLETEWIRIDAPVVTEVVPARRLRYEHRVLGGVVLRAEAEKRFRT